MNQIIQKSARGRPVKNHATRRGNVFKQLMNAKNELALQLVEETQENWRAITGVLMGKALEGDMRAMALLLDYVIEKAPQKFQIQTQGMDVGSMSMEDLMRVVVTYDSMIQGKRETILGEAEEIESHSINLPPPPPEFSSESQSQKIEMENGNDIGLIDADPEAKLEDIKKDNDQQDPIEVIEHDRPKL